MDNIHEFPDRATIDQEAADWLARLDADTALSPEEESALREWLGRSPRHQEALASLNRFWSNNILTELMVPLGRQERHVSSSSTFRYLFNGWKATSAVAATLLVALSIWLFSAPHSEFQTNGFYATAVGQQQTFVLDDGSRVHLNTDSQLEVEYDQDYRNLRLLQGEAYFEVAKNPERPFRVYAGAGRVQAVGTAFNILLDQSRLNVMVTEGRVSLASLGEQLAQAAPLVEQNIDPYVHSKTRELGTLDAGEAVKIDASENFQDDALLSEIEHLDENKISQLQSWREGYIVFSGESLEEVISELTRYTTLSISIADPNLSELQIGGRFKIGDTDSMFAALEANFGIQVRQLNYNQVELTLAQ